MDRIAALRTVLVALNDEIEPAVSGDRALASLRSIRNVIAFLITEAAGQRPAPVSFGLPWDYFRSAAAYRSMEGHFDSLLGSGGLASPRVARLLRWEKRAVDRVAAALTQALAVPQIGCRDRAPAVDREALAAYLRSRILGCGDLRVAAFRQFADGRSKLTGLAQLQNCAGLASEVVLRMDLPISATRSPSVCQEYEVLKLLHGRGLTVPKPLLLESRPDVLGAPFILMDRAQGSPASGLLGPPRSRAVARMLASELAKLHQVPLPEAHRVLSHPAVPDRATMLAELDAFEASWREHDPEPSLGMRFAFGWLYANIHLAVEGDPALTHRDPLFHNVLAEGDSMTALLDWEFVRIGYPAEDLGWIRTVVSQAMPWEEFMSAYRQAGGADIRPAVVDFYAIWAAVRLGMMLTYSNWLTLTGQTSSIEYTSTALRETHVARQWLAAHLERVLACARVPRSEPR